MTREKAIKALNYIKETGNGESPYKNDAQSIALDMAISALSTDGEYIKKEDAISKILVEFVAREENGKVMCACHDVKQTCADILDGLQTYSFPDSAENKGDLIRRQAVKDIILGGVSTDTDVDKEYVCGLIDNLPSVENKGEWTPVSERLPEMGVRVLCACQADLYDVLKLTPDGWFYDTRHTYMFGFVLAWQPLPEPYKKGE